MNSQSDHHLPIVAIVGAGFGGLEAAKNLRDAPVNVTLFDRNNYHLFQPLLYQVATGGLAPTEIAYPVRAIFRHQKNFHFQLAEVRNIDLENRQIQTDTGPLSYDYLILAVGGESNFFGMQSIAQYGFALKELEDSIAIRNHILRMFELSIQESDPVRCQALRTFLIVGGGPTGVECAGALSELIRLVLIKDFPDMDVSDVRVLLLEMAGGLLSGFPEDLGRSAEKTLSDKHVEIRFNAAVEDYDGQRALLKSGEEIPAYTLIWAAGVKAAGLVDRLHLPQGRQGRLKVGPTLQPAGHPEVFVIGDAAYLEENGLSLPMMAPVAIQQGKLAAENIKRHIAGKPLKEFEYHDPGSLATIGRNAAVARIGRLHFTGFLAWLVWLGVHLFWLIGFRNRLLVMIDWASDYIFYERAVRVITSKPATTPGRMNDSSKEQVSRPDAEEVS